jgi:hypothetical protein
MSQRYDIVQVQSNTHILFKMKLNVRVGFPDKVLIGKICNFVQNHSKNSHVSKFIRIMMRGSPILRRILLFFSHIIHKDIWPEIVYVSREHLVTSKAQCSIM